jgi:putative endonuclease
MHGGPYFTYIVASKSRTLYTGMTGDLLKRVFQHKQKVHEGFSSRYNCNRLVWFERFANVSEAIQREKELKGWTRARKIALIQSANPTWEDLSEQWYPTSPQARNPGLSPELRAHTIRHPSSMQMICHPEPHEKVICHPERSTLGAPVAHSCAMG